MPVSRKWQEAAKIMDRVGARLSLGIVGRAISSTEIHNEFDREAGRANFDGVVDWFWQPSDYCYNSVNRGKESMTCPIFLRHYGDNRYEYLGLNSRSYSGPVYWQDRYKNRKPVGNVVDGQITLWHDPRKG